VDRWIEGMDGTGSSFGIVLNLIALILYSFGFVSAKLIVNKPFQVFKTYLTFSSLLTIFQVVVE